MKRLNTNLVLVVRFSFIKVVKEMESGYSYGWRNGCGVGSEYRLSGDGFGDHTIEYGNTKGDGRGRGN